MSQPACGAEISAYSQELDYNPCLECKLCVAACPVGAIGADGAFNFSSCYTHNYREFMGGFADWAENLADSRDGKDYRRRVKESESVSMWQSLSFGANYKAAYCMAVCPAGEDVIGPYLASKKDFTDDVLRPLQAKREPVYVVRGSDAETHVQKRYPHKTVRQVRNSLRDGSGKLFEERFQSKPILDDEYLATVTIYNDVNAYRAGRVKTPLAHIWSTGPMHAGRAGRIPGQLWTPSAWYLALGATPQARATRYREIVAERVVAAEDTAPTSPYQRRLERPDRTSAQEMSPRWGDFPLSLRMDSREDPVPKSRRAR